MYFFEHFALFNIQYAYCFMTVFKWHLSSSVPMEETCINHKYFLSVFSSKLNHQICCFPMPSRKTHRTYTFDQSRTKSLVCAFQNLYKQCFMMIYGQCVVRVRHKNDLGWGKQVDQAKAENKALSSQTKVDQDTSQIY